MDWLYIYSSALGESPKHEHDQEHVANDGAPQTSSFQSQRRRQNRRRGLALGITVALDFKMQKLAVGVPCPELQSPGSVALARAIIFGVRTQMLEVAAIVLSRVMHFYDVCFYSRP